jgi:hypothetical protein
VKKIKLGAGLIGLGMALFLNPTLAQEPATFGDDASYIRVVFVSYKPGKAGEAYGIINSKFVPAAAEAGLPPPVVIHFQSGQFDAAFHWRLENGLADLEWLASPRNVAFRTALVAQEGGEEAADAVLDHYESLIARTTSAIGHRHIPEDEE